MASKKVQIQIDTKANTAGAQQAEQSLKKLDTTASKTNSTVNTTSASSSKLGNVMGQAGFQIQDFAVQVGAGTSALTAFSQQAPQLLGVFGPTGAVAGALVAVGAIAAKVFMTMGDDTQSATEKADFLADAIQKIAEKAGKMKSEEIDMGREAITQAIELTKFLQSGFDMVAASEQKYSAGALANAEALRVAQVELRRLRGEDVDELKEANNAEAFRIALIEQRKQQEIDSQNKRIAAAQQDIQNAQDELNLREQLLETARLEKDVEIQKLDTLKARKKELETQSKEVDLSMDAFSESGMTTSRTPRAYAAQEVLATTPFDAEIAVIEQKIESLSQATDSNSSELVTSLNAAAEGLTKANMAFESVTQSVELETANIVRAANTEAITETIKSRVTEAQANAQAVNAEIANFVPVNEIQAQALEAIKQRTGDLKITADETAIVAQNLQTIRNSLVQGQQLNVSATESIIKSLESYNLRLKELERRAQKLPAGKIN